MGSADYTALGAYRDQSGVTSRFGFTGKYYAQETSLWHLRARDLHPGLGRFLSADPVQPNAPGTQGYNLYAYVANNPTTWVDPSGYSLIWSAEALGQVFFNTYPHEPTPVEPGLIALNVGLSNTPVWGDLYDLYTGLSGYDPITGQYLMGWERLVNLVGVIPIPGVSGSNVRHGVHEIDFATTPQVMHTLFVADGCSYLLADGAYNAVYWSVGGRWACSVSAKVANVGWASN